MERYCIGEVENEKRYDGQINDPSEFDNSGYKLAPGTPKEDYLEDAAEFRDSTRG